MMPSAAAPHSTASICSTVGVLTRSRLFGLGSGTVGPLLAGGAPLVKVTAESVLVDPVTYSTGGSFTSSLSPPPPSTMSALQRVPLVIAKFGPRPEDHLIPLLEF